MSPQALTEWLFPSATAGTTGSLGSSHVTVNDGATLSFNKTGSYTVPNVISGDGTVVFANSAGTADLTGASDYTGPTVIQGGAVELGVNAQGPVTLGSGVDIQNGRVALDYTDPGFVSAVNGLVADAYSQSPRFAFGQFFSTTATATKGLGLLDNGSSVTIATAIYGDANLDGKVNASDFAALASHYGQSGAYWYQGDFNYDGTVDSADFNILAADYNMSLPTSSPALGTLVPEPASLGFLAAAAILGNAPPGSSFAIVLVNP